jgi:hypothetical protein
MLFIAVAVVFVTFDWTSGGRRGFAVGAAG